MWRQLDNLVLSALHTLKRALSVAANIDVFRYRISFLQAREEPRRGLTDSVVV